MPNPNATLITNPNINTIDRYMEADARVARRSFKKSRNGCKACKLRKVKCDEKTPICDHCAVHYVDPTKWCLYGDAAPGAGTAVMPSRLKPAERRGSSTSSRCIHETPDLSHLLRLPKGLRADLLDPFLTHPDCQDPKIVNPLMKHYFSTCIFNMFPYYPAPGKNPQTEFYAPIVQKDPVLFHVSLQLAAIHLEKVQPERGTALSTWLMGQSLSLLNERAKKFPELYTSDETIGAVAGLAAIEHEKGNMRTVCKHMRGLRSMLDLRGGLNGLRKGNKMVANIVFCMFVAAVDQPFPEVDQTTVPDEPPWYRTASNALAAAQGFIDFSDYGLNDHYTSVLNDIRLLTHTYQTADDCASAEEYLSVLTFLCSTLQRVLCLSIPDTDDPQLLCIAKACRSALIIHVFAQWCGHQPDPSMMVSNARHELIKALRPLMQAGVSNSLTLWLLAAGGVGSKGFPERIWFVGHLAGTLEDMGIASWEAMRAALMTVIWHGYQDEGTHLELWDEVAAKVLT